MIDKLTSISPGATFALNPQQPVREASAAAPAQAAAPEQPAGLETPPPEVLDALDAAQRALADLRSRQIELRYDVDPQTRKVHAQVVASDGRILREIPARHALDILAGTHVVDSLG